jgi:hypothetical protein
VSDNMNTQAAFIRDCADAEHDADSPTIESPLMKLTAQIAAKCAVSLSDSNGPKPWLTSGDILFALRMAAMDGWLEGHKQGTEAMLRGMRR